MKKVLFMLPLFALAVSVARAEGRVTLESVSVPDFVSAARVSGVDGIPSPAASRAEEPVSQELITKFNKTDNSLAMLRNDITWVGNDLDNLDMRAQRIIRDNTSDPFFQSDLDNMSYAMSRRVQELRRLSADIKDLLNRAQKSPELNKYARNMERSAREIQGQAWPRIEDAAGRLESTISFANPQVIGYNAQWTARDISRYTREFSDQSRIAAADTKSLAAKTQP